MKICDKKLVAVMGIVLWFACQLFAQTAPQAEPVYGGYIEWIDVIPNGTDSSRVFVSTASANSMFYADISNLSGTPSAAAFQTVPDLDADDNFGAMRCFAVEENSGFIFAGLGGGGLVAAGTTDLSRHDIDPAFIEAVEAYNSFLFYLVQMGNEMHISYTNVNLDGSVGTIASVKVADTHAWNVRNKLQIIISPYDNYVYVFAPGEPPFLYKSSDTYDSFATSTTFSELSVTDLSSAGLEYFAASVAPDGRIFAAGYDGNSSSFRALVSYSDSDGDPWTTVTLSEDIGRGAMKIAGDSANYIVYCSRAMSDDKGASWMQHGGADGAISPDPLNPDIAYVRTDWAIGMYNHATGTVDQINDGLLAVEVNDFSMDTTKSTAWVATKSGIWHVADFLGSPTWSGPIWPQYDSVPWDRVICTATGDTAYMGNASGNLYRYEAADGSPDHPESYERLFAAELATGFPLWHWTYGTRVSAIAIDKTSSAERVFIGLYDDEDWDETADSLGGVFVGTNSGGSWNWQQITGAPIPDTGADINDIVVVAENGSTVAYVGVERNTSYGTVNGVYRIEETGSSWNISNDLFLDASTPISTSIHDLHVTGNDTIFACGTDASGTTPTIYKKAVGDTYWSVITPSGLPFPNTARVIAYDDDSHNLYTAIDNVVYELLDGATAWQVYWEYPEATDISVLYFDDLIVGTGIGLYNHTGVTSAVAESGGRDNLPARIQLMQNYPNPFNPSTVIRYEIPARATVSLKVYDVLGREVAILFQGEQEAGVYSATLTAVQTQSLASGVYFYRLTAGGKSVTKKLLLMK